MSSSPLTLVRLCRRWRVLGGYLQGLARENNVRLIVKGTGHDYMGRSIAANSLSIWTHHMKGIDYHEGSFTPGGCSEPIEGNAVAAAAGTQIIDLLEYLDARNETAVGGASKTVGVWRVLDRRRPLDALRAEWPRGRPGSRDGGCHTGRRARRRQRVPERRYLLGHERGELRHTRHGE